MRTLYLDNYKGFINTFIPFKDVNFLVDENSTGKTTVLNLLSVITGRMFGTNMSFNTENVVLGYYSEMVNQNAKDRTFFSIGFEGLPYNRNKEIGISFIWMKFNKKDDVPNLSELMFIVNKYTILISLKKTYFNYYLENYYGEDFETWINSYNMIKEKRYKRVNKKTSVEWWSLPYNQYRIVRDVFEREGIKEKDIYITYPLEYVITTFSPIRAKSKRIYEGFEQSFSPEGAHTPIMLRNLLLGKNDDKRNEEFINNLISFGRRSSLFDTIKVKDFSKLEKGPFEVDIVYGKLSTKITNVGFGISQVLPLVTDISISRNKCFAIQQPEVHLHPKAQAEFGDFIFNSATNENNKFLIETHSNYMIDRFRIKPIAKGGADELNNLWAMHWKNNREKGDDYPTFKTCVTSNEDKNVEMEIFWTL